MADPGTLLGPLDALSGLIEPLLVVLVVANLGTRALADRSYRSQYAEEGADALSRFPVHEASNLLLVAGAFYYTTLHHHGGMVLSTLVVTTVVADFFEFEARKVEARDDRRLDRPKAALAASMLVFVYVLYQVGFEFVAPLWDQVF